MVDARCPNCGAVLSDPASEGTQCPRCLLALGLMDAPTRGSESIRSPATVETRASPGNRRFLPGQLLLGRYRIVAPLGRGGMGDVYRGDDLKLGEPVALKFLPERFQRDPALVSVLLNEVRIARKVSHPNVCRVFDVGELDGQYFLTMEYVDGEDLASLLRRIGRLSRDRAIEVAHQLLLGLAAVHRHGVLHHDIKPANAMIDARGSVRLMDFGLAATVHLASGGDGRAGTPGYMAPERLAGKAATERSDLYSLGILLYEVFTGRGPFAEAADDGPVTPPSMHVRGLDRRVEALILSCLDPDPERRPPSAAAAAAMLPGRDALSMSLVTGETPLPKVVANAVGPGGLRRRVAWAWLLTVAALLAVGISLAPKTQLTRMVPLNRSPDVLRAASLEILKLLDYDEPPVDRLFGFEYEPRILEWARGTSAGPSPITFWYRQSPEHLVRGDLVNRRASYDDPPWTVPGMVGVRLDTLGRLLAFDAVPRQHRRAHAPPSASDWEQLLRLAGFEPDSVEEVEASRWPSTFADTRHAWKGRHPDAPSAEVRIEAASLEGRVVAFRVQGPWSEPSRFRASRPPTPMASGVRTSSPGFWTQASQFVYLALLLVGLVGGAVVARSNLRARRGHPVGALRLAVYLLVAGMVIWTLGSHHVPTGDEFRMFIRGLAIAVFWSFVAWLLYVAVEPYLRRIWPRTMVSWIRLLEGRFRDPLVGRDLLIGCAIGVALSIAVQLYQVAPGWLGFTPPRPDFLNGPANELDALRGLRYSIAGVLTVHCKQTFYALLYVCVLVILKLLLRRTWLALTVFVTLGGVLTYRATGHLLSDLLVAASLVAVCAAAFFRFGLVTMVASLTVAYLPGAVTMTPDVSSWHAHGTVLVILLVLGLAFHGFHVSLVGRGMFGDSLVRDPSPE
jgi:predicted Ser/Thr protein kinase